MESPSFKDQLRAGFAKILRHSPYILLLAFVLYPLIPSAPYKLVTMFLLGMSILRVLLDIDVAISKRLGELEVRAKTDHERLMSKLKDADPPNWENFGAAERDVRSDIRQQLLQPARSLRIDVLGVSAKYSWPMLDDLIPELLRDVKYANCKLDLSIAVCDRDLLVQWGLIRQVGDLEKTLKGVAQLRQECKDLIASGSLSIEVYKFDSLPMWHGLLLGDRILYMGRTRWDMSNSDEPPRLQVGSRDYRKFARHDSFGGDVRIEMFNNWFSRLKLRHKELEARGTIARGESGANTT